MQKYNYSYLRGFILDNKRLGTLESFAKFLNISNQALYSKMNGETRFTQDQIAKVKKEFDLSDEDVVKFFFYVNNWENSIKELYIFII